MPARQYYISRAPARFFATSLLHIVDTSARLLYNADIIATIFALKGVIEMIALIRGAVSSALNENLRAAKIDVDRMGDAPKRALKHLENLVTAMYLECWLELDENAKQTLSSFAKKEYMLQTERKNNRGGGVNGDWIKALQRAELVYLTMQKKRQSQAEKENSAPTTLPELKSQYHGRKYSFFELRHIALLARGDLELYKLLTSKTHPMTVSVHKKTERHVALLNAYDKYEAIFKQAKSISSDREYVAACVQMRKFESAFRFLLIARLAVYCVDNDISINILNRHFLDGKFVDRHVLDDKFINKRILHNFELMWGRFAYFSVDNQNYSLISEPYDILYYDQKIKRAFESCGLTYKSEIWRSLYLSTDALLKRKLPLKNQPSWTDKDFESAAQFFKRDYPIFESYTSLWGHHESKSTGVPGDKGTQQIQKKAYAGRIQGIYQIISDISGSDLNNLRATIKPAKKNDNSN